MKLKELISEVGGSVEGDGDIEVSAVAEPESAGPGDLSWIGEERYSEFASQASVLLIGSKQEIPAADSGQAIWRHPEPNKTFALAIARLMPEPEADYCGIHPSAVIIDGAEVAEDCHIGPGAFIGGNVRLAQGVVVDPGAAIYGPTSIGSGTRVHSRVTILGGCTIGADCILHPGAVIGGEGFGFVPDAGGAIRVPHRGGVILGDAVEVGCLSAIDRGVLGDTRIGTGTKIDNLVHVAHNVQIGSHSFLAAQVGIAGSATIGDQCEFGGQSGMIGHVEIGSKVRVAAKSAIFSGGAEDVTLMGIPATEAGKMRRIFAILQQLPELRDRILEIEKTISEEKT